MSQHIVKTIKIYQQNNKSNRTIARYGLGSGTLWVANFTTEKAPLPRSFDTVYVSLNFFGPAGTADATATGEAAGDYENNDDSVFHKEF